MKAINDFFHSTNEIIGHIFLLIIAVALSYIFGRICINIFIDDHFKKRHQKYLDIIYLLGGFVIWYFFNLSLDTMSEFGAK